MSNILRWALCQLFGKIKGVAVHLSIMSGSLGEEIRNADENAIGALLAHAGAAMKMSRNSGR